MDWKLGALWSTISIHLGHVYITMKIVKENESTSNNTESVFETSSYKKVSGSETLEFGRFIWEQTWRMNFTYITVWNDSIALEIIILFLENFLPENFTFILLPQFVLFDYDNLVDSCNRYVNWLIFCVIYGGMWNVNLVILMLILFLR